MSKEKKAVTPTKAQNKKSDLTAEVDASAKINGMKFRTLVVSLLFSPPV
jgi:hypothetical protein